MRHLLPPLLSLSLLLAWAAPTRAQTAGPTPTPGPASATQLLAQMRSAMLQQGTVHAVLDASGSVPNRVSFSMEVTADVSLRDGALHSATTSAHSNLVRHSTSSERSELKVTGGRGAWRVPHMQWQCEKLLPQDVSGGLLAFQAQPQTAKLAGTGTVNGVAVWKVTGKAVIVAWTGTQKKDRVEFDIAQSTGLPVQVSTRFKTHWGQYAAGETLVERYTNFGSAMTITLPKKCR